MKLYEEIDDLEKKIFRAKEQASFLKCTLESVDRAVELKKQKLGEDIAAYNKRAKRDQEVLEMYNNNIALWTKKLDKLLSKQIKKIDKEKVEVVVEQSEKELRKEALNAKKRLLAEELKRAKDQLELLQASKELKKGEEAEIIEDIVEEVAEEIFEEDFTVDIEPESAPIIESISPIKWLINEHSDWIEEFALDEGGNAIWHDAITKTFRTWCESKGYILPV